MYTVLLILIRSICTNLDRVGLLGFNFIAEQNHLPKILTNLVLLDLLFLVLYLLWHQTLEKLRGAPRYTPHPRCHANWIRSRSCEHCRRAHRQHRSKHCQNTLRHSGKLANSIFLLDSWKILFHMLLYLLLFLISCYFLCNSMH